MSSPTPDPNKPKKRFLDSWTATGIMVTVILGVRFYIYEPFKIPSGSMEPTLVGHEDYGDRIVTDKLAYKGTDPKRFDIVVFEHNKEWENEKPLKRNYIKRLVGLPGETLIINGGDLFLKDPKTNEEKIIRKWKDGSPDLQERLWVPVSLSTFTQKKVPDVNAAPKPPLMGPDGKPLADQAVATAQETLAHDVAEDENRMAFPWNVKAETGASATLETKSLNVQGDVTLTYDFPVSNAYVKMGRWPFMHLSCPKGDNSDPTRTTSFAFMAYLPQTSAGVRCPRCGRLQFPLVEGKTPGMGPREIVADTSWSTVATDANKSVVPSEFGEAAASNGTPFFYGGHRVDGDLKIELELEVSGAGGALEIQTGSNLHRAGWVVSLGGQRPEPAKETGRHELDEAPVLDAGKKHTLSLAWVDGTILAKIDGKELAPKEFDIKPVDWAELKSIAKLHFIGEAKCTVTKLELYRDLFYTLSLDNSPNGSPIINGSKDDKLRSFDATRKRYEAQIPADHFMVCGDNSPSSADSRVWGFVPRDKMLGKAKIIWWPPSRWRVLY